MKQKELVVLDLTSIKGLEYKSKTDLVKAVLNVAAVDYSDYSKDKFINIYRRLAKVCVLDRTNEGYMLVDKKDSVKTLDINNVRDHNRIALLGYYHEHPDASLNKVDYSIKALGISKEFYNLQRSVFSNKYDEVVQDQVGEFYNRLYGMMKYRFDNMIKVIVSEGWYKSLSTTWSIYSSLNKSLEPVSNEMSVYLDKIENQWYKDNNHYHIMENVDKSSDEYKSYAKSYSARLHRHLVNALRERFNYTNDVLVKKHNIKLNPLGEYMIDNLIKEYGDDYLYKTTACIHNKMYNDLVSEYGTKMVEKYIGVPKDTRTLDDMTKALEDGTVTLEEFNEYRSNRMI